MTELIIIRTARLFPTKKQERYFHKACSARVHIFNMAKQWDDEAKEARGERLTKRELAELVKEYKDSFHENLPFRIDHHTFRDGMFDYYEARKRAYTGKFGWPKFQSNRYRRTKSFMVRTDGNRSHTTIREGSDWVNLAGLTKVDPNHKYVKSNASDTFPFYKLGILSARVVWDGKYWSLHYSVRVNALPEEFYTEPIGLDLGISNFVTDSNGGTYPTILNDPTYKRFTYRVKHYQRKLGRQRSPRKSDGSNEQSRGYWRTRTKLQKVERDLAEYKKAFQISTAKDILASNPSTVVMENLSIKDMKASGNPKKLVSHIHQVGWYNFMLRVQHEQAKKMGAFILADKYFPSTKRCSSCGNVVDYSIPLDQRTYRCHICGYTEDRDVNAALNLRQLAL